MTADALRFGSRFYLQMFALLLFGRGCDFLSTWVATPNLVLEGNPLAKKLGWKLGSVVNLAICFGLAFWPVTAIVVTTASLLVSAHNFHSAWLMRTMGEENYRHWFTERVMETRRSLYIFCLLGETVLTGLVGAGLIYWYSDRVDSPAYAIGSGIVAYALIVLFYTSLSLWRLWRKHR